MPCGPKQLRGPVPKGFFLSRPAYYMTFPAVLEFSERTRRSTSDEAVREIALTDPGKANLHDLSFRYSRAIFTQLRCCGSPGRTITDTRCYSKIAAGDITGNSTSVNVAHLGLPQTTSAFSARHLRERPLPYRISGLFMRAKQEPRRAIRIGTCGAMPAHHRLLANQQNWQHPLGSPHS